MNTIIKTVLVIALTSAFLTVIGSLIPNPVSVEISDSITYFLSYANNLSAFIHVSVLFSAIHILANFIFGILVFFIYYFLIKLFV